MIYVMSPCSSYLVQFLKMNFVSCKARTLYFALAEWVLAKLNNSVYSVYTCTTVCTPLRTSLPRRGFVEFSEKLGKTDTQIDTQKRL